MIWLTWRQFRIQAAAGYAAAAALAVVLAVTGQRLAQLARIDANVFDRLTRTDRNLYFVGIVALALAPAVIGAFWGAPMVARELEAGTHRLAWTQSVTRTRWLATKLGITALAAAVVVGGLSLAVTWWSDPIDGALSRTRGSLPSRLTPVAFAMRGVAPVGYTVFALLLGVAVGLVVRRLLPAMAVTLILITVVQIAVPLWVRPHLLSPAEQTLPFSPARLTGIMADQQGRPVRLSLSTGSQGDWVLHNDTLNAAGRVVSPPTWLGNCLPGPQAVPSTSRGEVTGGLDACLARLNREGYRQHLTYLPASRFWALQWAETGLFGALAALLAGFCFWWTRRRLS